MRGSPFFEGVEQSEAQLGDRTIKFPVFYYDGESMTGVFPARLSKLRKLLPDPRFVPARIAPGLGVVTVTCFEYRDTDIDAYNELAIGIPLSYPHYRNNAPGLAMLDANRRGQFDAWVHHLPVTTQLACDGGVDFYNYPKFVASIDFTQDESSRTCVLAEGAEHILTMKCERLKATEPADVQLFSHLWQDRQPQSSEFKIHAERAGQSIKPGTATIEIADRHPIARELRSVLVSNRSIAASYMPRIEGILYGPEHHTVPVMRRVLASDQAHPAGVA
jgi:hypothetical protein